MRRLAILPVAAAATLLGAAASHTPSLDAAGWRHAEWHGIRPAHWQALAEDGVAVVGHGQGSFVWRPVRGQPACLGWRWRVDHGPPPMDLTRRNADRALAVYVGFQGWPPGVTAWQRARHAAAQALVGGHPLPRSMLIYVWGGTGREPDLFPSPYMDGLGRVRVLRPADAPRGQWMEERVDLAADWRAAFGGEPPPLQEIAIGTDTDNSHSPVVAAVEAIRFAPCR